MGLSYLKMALASAVVAGGLMSGVALAQEITVGLITKTETNPFFVKMREGAEAKAKELGLKLITAAGKFDGDNDGQVAAIENLISAGAKGFAIV
ncbi:MAG: substrate-binding domain-containing protein, partial [Devosia sp.]|nr:substrate-binding domain-containing protein [Devosia sp.]